MAAYKVNMEHVHLYSFQPSQRTGVYDIDIFQGFDNTIVVSIKNMLYRTPNSRFIDLKVKQKDGFAWKLTKTMIQCSSGQAADIIALFKEFPAYAKTTVQKLVFDRGI